MPDFLPNLFILGAAKCGTTTLHNYLSGLQDVCMSNPKEPFFFEAEYENGLGFYQEKYFSHWNGEQIIGESRHRNLIQPYVPNRIAVVNPKAKLIVIVREPVARAYSHWFHSYSRGDEELSFEQAVQADLERIKSGLDCSTEEEIMKHSAMLGKRHPNGEIGLGLYRTYVDSGYYMDQIERYLKLFDKEQLRVVIFEDMIKAPKRTVESIVNFLELDPSRNYFKNEIWKNKKKNELLWKNKHPLLKQISTYLPKSLKNKIKGVLIKQIESSEEIQISPAAKTFLLNHYQTHVKRLEDFLGNKIGPWQYA